MFFILNSSKIKKCVRPSSFRNYIFLLIAHPYYQKMIAFPSFSYDYLDGPPSWSYFKLCFRTIEFDHIVYGCGVHP